MNLNIGGITTKLQKHADKLTFLYAAWSRYPNVGDLIDFYTRPDGALEEINHSLTWKAADGTPLIVWKLLKSPHAYTGLFKLGAGLWLLNELGLDIIPKKYGAVGKKIAIGAGFAALTLGGSHGAHPPSSHSFFGSSRGSSEGCIRGS